VASTARQVDEVQPCSSQGSVRLFIEVGDIYQHSSVRLLAVGGSAFRLAVEATDHRGRGACLTGVTAGQANGLKPELRAEYQSGRWVIDAQVTGLLNEIPIDPSGEGIGQQSVLGVRWYPFISSRLGAMLTIDGAAVSGLHVSVAEAVRSRLGNPVWADEGAGPQQAMSYDADAWTTSIGWERPLTGNIELDLPVQTSPGTMSRAINGTVAGVVLSFAAIAVAAELASVYLAFGALAALALLFLREWRTGPRAHQLTALAAVYLGYTGLGFVWGLAWALCGLWALTLLPVVFIALLVGPPHSPDLRGDWPSARIILWSPAHLNAAAGGRPRATAGWLAPYNCARTIAGERMHDASRPDRRILRHRMQRPKFPPAAA
jgi:hypothetical protein